MTESLFYVDDSPIHGKGLFARKYIGAGEIIGVLDCIPTSTDGAYSGDSDHLYWFYSITRPS